jgi:hypothetical protein
MENSENERYSLKFFFLDAFVLGAVIAFLWYVYE